MKKIKYIITLLSFGFVLLSPAFASADSNNQIFGACNQTSGTQANSSVCKTQTPTQNPVVHTINTVANIIALLAGILAVIMIMISGFKYITGGGVASGQRAGDPNSIKSAKETLVASIVGLVIVVLAWAITIFITNNVIH